MSLESKKVALSLNNVSTVNPITTRTVTVSNSPPNPNYKIVKVLRSPTLIKPKNLPNSSIVIKLKSTDAFSAMLKTSKLIEFYKCMGHNCSYTTDSVLLYRQHYRQHWRESHKRKTLPPYDYQKCPYCYMCLSDWKNMENHLEEKHAHCQYQCSYCFYRAIVPFYVRLHQVLYINSSNIQLKLIWLII